MKLRRRAFFSSLFAAASATSVRADTQPAPARVSPNLNYLAYLRAKKIRLARRSR